MKTKYIFISLVFVLLVFANFVIAGEDRIGTAGAQELRIPVGTRGTAMGGSIIASVSGIESIYWNPAGLSQIKTTETIISHLNWFADIKVEYVATAVKLGNFGILGGSVKVTNIGDIIETTELLPEGTGRVINPTYIIASLTYSRALTDRVLIGSTIKYIHEQILRVKANGIVLDVGFQYTTGIRGLKFGIVMKNFGPNMAFDGRDLEEGLKSNNPVAAETPTRHYRVELSPFELPTSIDFGISYNLLESEMNNLVFSTTFKNNNFSGNEYQGGAEYSFRNMFFLRGGYTAAISEFDGFSPKMQKDYLWGPTAGFGLNLGLGNTSLALDYSFTSVSKYFDDVHQFSFRFGF
jgi:hypothetical protein